MMKNKKEKSIKEKPEKTGKKLNDKNCTNLEITDEQKTVQSDL